MSTSRQDPPEPSAESTRRRKIIDETIAKAMRPYIGKLPASALKTMRDVLEDTLTTHHVAVEALDALEERPSVGGSGTRVRGADDDDDQGEPGGREGVA
jgi:hypothetical protein